MSDNGFADVPPTPSLIKRLPSRPMPKLVYENPNPPTDPQYREVWEQARALCAENHPGDPVYAPYRFRRDATVLRGKRND